MQQKSGDLVISLDFELLWGVFDKVEFSQYENYFNNTRKVIPEILRYFERYGIHATWATVGMLFNKDWDEWNVSKPEIKPNYTNTLLSAYKYGDSIQNQNTGHLCFAPDLIGKIIETENQELATHTYSHYYCREEGQNLESFREDLKLSIEKANSFGANLRSLVFPRNQLNENYLKVCSDLGITSVRSNPNIWYWKDTEKDTLMQKIFRTGDAYIGKKDKPYHFSEIRKTHNLSVQPASRLLRPYSGKSILDKRRIKRIFSEITTAAKEGKIYHLWWHPHNFGADPEESLRELELILEHYKFCNERFGFQSYTMDEIHRKA
ncbi:polysaccharide deacetylase family protein [Salegentibacter chungangensis]|uniref:Polysaccharide deacetylase family protein n=1 Tax=Salegentibacter chungangensis TaxID=1335724 RepID=A0ABW3NTA9_9FLAO